jgi:hypothetical protein
MGFRAPSAEEVYNYVFRLDNHAARSLGDGFGWSILFVNDSSGASQQFLRDYGVELCHRTADRIRFVFFSGLDTDETEEAAQEANHRGGGLFTRIIARSTNRNARRRRFDWEREDWQSLRPYGFDPLRSQKMIEQHLSMESQSYSAMPGSREAFRFAQRLGIGRFAPCFCLFAVCGGLGNA